MAPAPTNGHNPTSQRRRGSRYTLQVPLDVTVLRWGIPDTVPGRSLNLSPDGAGAILAGELSPGEKVGVEIRLPATETPLRTRALVRHQDKLRCGFEFVGLSEEQKRTIATWAEKAVPSSPTITHELTPAKGSSENGPENGSANERPDDPPSPPLLSQRGWLLLLFSAVVLLSVLWWRWHAGWEDLESGLTRNSSVPQVQAQVAAEVMAKLVRHRVDPEYPAAARPQNLQGVIALDIIVDRDGSVLNVRPLGGPPILEQAAVDALRWWRFEPYRIQGKPVVAETTIAVEFKP